MTSPEKSNLNHCAEDSLPQLILSESEVDGTSLADLKKQNKNVKSFILKVRKYIVLVGGGFSIAAVIFFINPKQARAECIDVPLHTTTSSIRLTTSSLKSSSSPLNSLAVSHVCNKKISINKIPVTNMYSSDFNISRAPAYRSQSLTGSKDSFSKRCSAIPLCQPSAQILFQNSFQKEKKNPIFSKENFGLMGLIGFKCKKRRSIGRLHLSMIRQKNHNCKSSKLQYPRDLSLCEIVNSTKVMPIRTKCLKSRIQLLKRYRKEGVRAFSKKNNEKESLFDPEKERRIKIQQAINEYKLRAYVAGSIYLVAQNLPSSFNLPMLLLLLPRFAKMISIKNLSSIAPIVDTTVNVLNSITDTKGAQENESIPTTERKTQMEYISKVQNIESRTLAAIEKDNWLETIIVKAKLKDIESVGLGKNGAISRFQTLQEIWNCEETQVLIDAYDRGEPQLLLNRISASRYLSIWNPDLPLYTSSCRFKQKMLERTENFTGRIERKLRFITDSEKYSFKPLAKGITRKPIFTKLILLSNTLPSMDAQITKKEEVFSSEDFDIWVEHERELVSTSFEHARKRYEQTTGSNVLQTDLQQCINDFLKEDFL